MLNKKRVKISALSVLFTCGLFILIIVCFNVHAQTISPDAIAIRVIPNSEHYSALRWYQEKGFTGSPQSLTVDGYEAVRDGRTVYVNAANIDLAADTLHTNIYLISYNQEAETATRDIFSQILKHWKFNTNITDIGQCSEAFSLICVLDHECPAGEYCDSQKARIIRDTWRLADFADIKDSLEDYNNANGSFPQLLSGSYLPNRTLSVWPSWQRVLAQYLGPPLPVDPINKLGDCGEARFNPATCWDDNAKEFSGTVPDGLPGGSMVYAYQADSHSYNLCAQMETDYANIVPINCFTDISDNNPPEIAGINLPTGCQGMEYIGYISASDPDGDALTWTLDPLATNWSTWSGASAPILRNTSVINQKQIYSAAAGDRGNYAFSVTVNDNRGGVDSLTDSITIIDGVFTVTAPANDFFYVAPTGVPIGSLDHFPISYFGSAITTAVDAVIWSLTPLTALPFGLTVTIHSTTGDINASASDNNTNPGFYDIMITAANQCGASHSDSFTLEVRANEWCTPDCTCAATTCIGNTCSDGCGGTCAGTQVCACTPDCSCAATTCIGSTCSDGCGGTCAGTQVCACTPDCSCAATTCIGSTCSDGCGGTCAGIKDCSSPPCIACSDGTLPETCVAGDPPRYCNSSCNLIDDCGLCGCPASDPICKTDNSCKPVCDNNNTCDHNETWINCPSDCFIFLYKGGGTCNADNEYDGANVLNACPSGYRFAGAAEAESDLRNSSTDSRSEHGWLKDGCAPACSGAWWCGPDCGSCDCDSWTSNAGDPLAGCRAKFLNYTTFDFSADRCWACYPVWCIKD